jgi:subtilisin-like proprotein convertase family protein
MKYSRPAAAAATLGLVGGALLLIPAAPAAAAAVPSACTTTYTDDTPTPIVDVATIERSLDVPAADVITDVRVKLTALHTFDADLEFTLLHNGTVVDLSSDNGGAGDNYVNTVFDDNASVPITGGTAPFTGSFTPEQPLSAFAGGNAAGTWTLRVTDDLGGDFGSLTNWSVTVGTQKTGCPAKSRNVTLKRTKKHFKGRLKSGFAPCKAGQKVQVWKVRPGADLKVGTAKTSGAGSYKLKRKAKAGKYYALAQATILPTQARCLKAKSPKVRVKK